MTRRELIDHFLEREDTYYDFKSFIIENHPDYNSKFSYQLVDKIDEKIKECFEEMFKSLYFLIESEINGFEYDNLRIGFQVGYDLAMILMGEPQHYNVLWQEEETDSGKTKPDEEVSKTEDF